MEMRYTFAVEGRMHLLKPAIESQGEVMEPFFELEGWVNDHRYFGRVPALYINRNPTASVGSEVALVIMTFIASGFAKKIFDEIYDRTLKRPIGKQLDRLFKKIEVPSGKHIEYRDIVYFEDLDLVVVIRCLATKEGTQDLQSQVMQAHRVAHSYIELHGRKAPVHCHQISNGQISMEPETFESLEAIKQHDMAQLKVARRFGPPLKTDQEDQT